jgi:hypothetical protein
LILATLLAPVSSSSLADPSDQPDMACLERVARKLPGPVKPASIKPWPIKGKKLGTKRLIFRRDGVFLVVDHSAIHDGLVSFLGKHDDTRFPEGRNLMRRFERLLEDTSEAVVDDTTMTMWERKLLDRRLGAVLEDGKFAIRASEEPLAKPSGPEASTIIRLDWSYYCGDLCAGTGRTFITRGCQVLASVTDKQS